MSMPAGTTGAPRGTIQLPFKALHCISLRLGDALAQCPVQECADEVSELKHDNLTSINIHDHRQ